MSPAVAFSAHLLTSEAASDALRTDNRDFSDHLPAQFELEYNLRYYIS
jgi:hypothetical protein